MPETAEQEIIVDCPHGTIENEHRTSLNQPTGEITRNGPVEWRGYICDVCGKTFWSAKSQN
jgi:hypothetical protein